MAVDTVTSSLHSNQSLFVIFSLSLSKLRKSRWGKSTVSRTLFYDPCLFRPKALLSRYLQVLPLRLDSAAGSRQPATDSCILLASALLYWVKHCRNNVTGWRPGYRHVYAAGQAIFLSPQLSEFME